MRSCRGGTGRVVIRDLGLEKKKKKKKSHSRGVVRVVSLTVTEDEKNGKKRTIYGRAEGHAGPPFLKGEEKAIAGRF